MKVLKFGAVWCSGCLVMRPRWRSIELPVFVFLDKKGRQFLKLSGEISEKELEKTVLAHKNK